MYQLAHYINADSGEEFVVILTPEENQEDYAGSGFELAQALDIVGDAIVMPCSRELKAV